MFVVMVVLAPCKSYW